MEIVELTRESIIKELAVNEYENSTRKDIVRLLIAQYEKLDDEELIEQYEETHSDTKCVMLDNNDIANNGLDNNLAPYGDHNS